MYGIIYKVTNILNHKIYIGQSICPLSQRKAKHYYKARHEEPNNTNNHFLNALRKYPEEDFLWEVIDTANSRRELNEKESYWIGFYDCIKNGYNIRKGGETRTDDDAFAKSCGSQYCLMYDWHKNFIGRFINKRDIERKYQVNHSDISQILEGKSYFSNGYTFFNENEYSEQKLQDRINAFKKTKGIFENPVMAKNIKTSSISGPYQTLTEIRKDLSIDTKHIKEVLSKKRKTCNGYYFWYKGKEDINE